MRIAHINNIAGVASTIAEYQKKHGHMVNVFVFNKMIHDQFGGIKINYRSPFSLWKFFRTLKKNYDTWHYHYPYGSLKISLEKRNEDKIYLKHYHGDDIRGKHDDDFCLVSSPDLLKFTPNGKWVPTPIDIPLLENIVNDTKKDLKKRNRINILHYPYYKNNPPDYIDYYSDTLGRLQKENKCEITKIYQVPHTQALNAIYSSDIVIGKILPHVGWFGKLELEGMALSKAIISYVSDDLYEKYKPPIYRTTKDTFKQDLESLIQDEDEQNRLGKEGRNYVRKYHSIGDVMKKIHGYYADASRNLITS